MIEYKRKRKLESYKAILWAAVKVVESGDWTFNVERIAAAADRHRRTVYTMFKTRDELVRAVMERYGKHIQRIFSELSDDQRLHVILYGKVGTTVVEASPTTEAGETP